MWRMCIICYFSPLGRLDIMKLPENIKILTVNLIQVVFETEKIAFPFYHANENFCTVSVLFHRKFGEYFSFKNIVRK